MSKCKAKKPELCRYHGRLRQVNTELDTVVNQLLVNVNESLLEKFACRSAVAVFPIPYVNFRWHDGPRS